MQEASQFCSRSENHQATLHAFISFAEFLASQYQQQAGSRAREPLHGQQPAVSGGAQTKYRKIEITRVWGLKIKDG